MEPKTDLSPAQRMAEGYERLVVGGIFRYWTPLLLRHVPPQPGDRVLDLACGTGIVSRSVVPLVQPGGVATGLDLNPGMLAVAARLVPGKAAWLQGRAERLPFSEQAFDLVFCQQGLQFFTNRAAAVGEICRVLSRNGRVGIAAWQGLETLPLYQAIYDTIQTRIAVPDEVMQSGFNLGADELAGLLRDAGFQDISVNPFRQVVHVEDPGLFARMMTLGAPQSSPQFKQLPEPEQQAILAELNQQVAQIVNEHVENGVLTFPMFANFARGTRL